MCSSPWNIPRAYLLDSLSGEFPSYYSSLSIRVLYISSLLALLSNILDRALSNTGVSLFGANASECFRLRFHSLKSRSHFSLRRNKLLPLDPGIVKSLLTLDMACVNDLLVNVCSDLDHFHFICIFSFSTSSVQALFHERVDKLRLQSISDIPEKLSWGYVALVVMRKVLKQLGEPLKCRVVNLAESHINELGDVRMRNISLS